jgi:UDP-glucose 4-epimerase
MNKPLDGKRILITGGTGSLGKVLLRRLLTGEAGEPSRIIIYSRDEAKQHFMRVAYQQRPSATDEIIYRNFQQKIQFWIGDIRDLNSVAAVLREADVVVNAAALKQVPTCEYFPFEAVRTNIEGAENIVRAIQTHDLKIETVVGVSTDKACKPVNAMGMTKALQERVFIQGNMRAPGTRFVCVRYGNVLASRGSVIPLFHEQIKNGGPVTLTTTDMTRFLLSLDDAVDTVLAAIRDGDPGETYVPRAPSASMAELAEILIDGRPIETVVTGIRPGEKVHEILVSEEEAHRTVDRGRWYAILPILPEVCGERSGDGSLSGEYGSRDTVLDRAGLTKLLRTKRLMVGEAPVQDGELLR